MAIVIQDVRPIHWLAPDSYGPRKRLLPLPGQFFVGDILRVERTGENMIVIRDFGDRPMVRRGRGTLRAQPIIKGDRIMRIA